MNIQDGCLMLDQNRFFSFLLFVPLNLSPLLPTNSHFLSTKTSCQFSLSINMAVYSLSNSIASTDKLMHDRS